MALNKNINWERWVQGELIASLQSKGKIAKKQTEASQYKEKANSNTHNRIFPAEEGDASFTATMLAEARSKLTTAVAQAEYSKYIAQQQQQEQMEPPQATAVQPVQQQVHAAMLQGGGVCGSVCDSITGSRVSHVDSKASCRTNKSQVKARVASLQQQLAEETKSLNALQAAIASAKEQTGSP